MMTRCSMQQRNLVVTLLGGSSALKRTYNMRTSKSLWLDCSKFAFRQLRTISIASLTGIDSIRRNHLEAAREAPELVRDIVWPRLAVPVLSRRTVPLLLSERFVLRCWAVFTRPQATALRSVCLRYSASSEAAMNL